MAGEAGATGVSGIGTAPPGGGRGIFMEWLGSYRPDLVERYEELYARRAYPPRVEQERLGALVRRRARDALGRRLPARSVARLRREARYPIAARRATSAGTEVRADEAVLTGRAASRAL